MQVITFILYVLALALTFVLLFWASMRIMAAMRARRHGWRGWRRKSGTSTTGTDTQYSLFSQLPIEEETEYDPLAEAEIYVTYGNRQMAIDTLIKAAQDYPEREDIKVRLAELEQPDNT